MTYESKLANIIAKLKEVKGNHPEISLQAISDHTGVSFSTVARIFAEGSENQSFRYDSIRPIADMLLCLDDLGAGDENEKALKTIIQFKDTAIKQLKEQIETLKEKNTAKLEKERAAYDRKIDFLKNQIELKDARITLLLDALMERDKRYSDLHQEYSAVMDQLVVNKELINKILEKG